MSITPLEWFCNSDLKYFASLLPDGTEKIDLVSDFGWEEGYLWEENESINCNLPNISGIYVVKHLYISEFLYVGESGNIYKRIKNSHTKLSAIIEILRSYSPLGGFDRDSIANDLIIYFKEVDKEDFGAPIKRCLIWCEALTIGILRPIYQHNVEDIRNFLERYGCW
ncbi:hypothetical protein [Anabaena sp. CCY 9402-a]|uniref:hypothetical protein n=1 Tax=Anabaena sp. CCY 9402-a TaxID=3103867 RepID=UPI0039C73A2A